MKKRLVGAVFALAAIAAFAGTCSVTHIALTLIGTHDTFAGQIDNNSGVNILEHQIRVTFLDSSNNVVQTTTATPCLRSLQNGRSDFFSVASSASDTSTSTGLARLANYAEDTNFKIGTTVSGSVTIDNIAVNRSTTTLTVSGDITNTASNQLFSPHVCVVVRDSSGAVIVVASDTGSGTLATSGTSAKYHFIVSPSVPDNSTASTVDVWVDGLDNSSSGTPITPISNTGISVTNGTTASKLSFTTTPAGTITGGVAFPTQPSVTVKLSDGTTTDTGSVAPVTLSIKSGTGTAGATLTCDANPKAAVAGIDTFTGCKIDKSGTGYVLVATSGTATAESSPFNVVAGPATKVAFSPQPGGATATTDLSTQPSVLIQDAGGNTVTTGTDSTKTVTLGIATGTGGAVLLCDQPSNAIAAVAGVAAFTGCQVNLIGTYTLNANALALTIGLSSSFNITGGAQTITFAAINDQAAGAFPLTLPLPTSTSTLDVTLTSNTTSVCTVDSPTHVVTRVAAGTCTIVASQAGDATYAPATPVTRTFMITS